MKKILLKALFFVISFLVLLLAMMYRRKPPKPRTIRELQTMTAKEIKNAFDRAFKR